MFYSTLQIKIFLTTVPLFKFLSCALLMVLLATPCETQATLYPEEVVSLSGGVDFKSTANKRSTIAADLYAVRNKPGAASEFRPFVTTWKTDNPGNSINNQIEIPTTGTGYNYNIYWEEVNNPTNNGKLTGINGNHIISFPRPGTYRIKISGDFPQIYFSNSADQLKILTIEQWGDIAWRSMKGAFNKCSNLTIPASDAPDLSKVTNMSGMFAGAAALNQDINSWNVSGVTNMYGMFKYASSFNQDLNSWDVGRVTDMGEMFRGANSFNGDISSWRVSRVVNMAWMFSLAASFNGDISNWQVDSVTDMFSMFYRAGSFNQDLSSWNVSRVTDMGEMFHGASSFNGDISTWFVGNVIRMGEMFRGATSFNQDLTSWNVSGVNDMYAMFKDAVNFNGDISSWDISQVSVLTYMFSGASSFNQNIGNWKLSSRLTHLSYMFSGARSFNQDLSRWDVSSVGNMSSMLDSSGISTVNYDLLLQGWLANANGLSRGVSLGVAGLNYCKGDAARQALINDYGWSISGDELDCGQIITFAPLATKSVGDPDFELKATVSSGLAVTYTSSNETVATIAGNIVTIKGEGTSTITASQQGNQDFEAADPVEQIFVVQKAKSQQHITLEAIEDKEANAAPFDVVASASSGLLVNLEISGPAMISGSTITINGTAGTVILIASQPGNEAFLAAEPLVQSFEVIAVTGLTELEKTGIRIYPNPVADYLQLEVPAKKETQLSLLNMEGKVVFELENKSQRVNISMLKRGFYFLKVATLGKTTFFKIIKE